MRGHRGFGIGPRGRNVVPKGLIGARGYWGREKETVFGGRRRRLCGSFGGVVGRRWEVLVRAIGAIGEEDGRLELDVRVGVGG